MAENELRPETGVSNEEQRGDSGAKNRNRGRRGRGGRNRGAKRPDQHADPGQNMPETEHAADVSDAEPEVQQNADGGEHAGRENRRSRSRGRRGGRNRRPAAANEQNGSAQNDEAEILTGDEDDGGVSGEQEEISYALTERDVIAAEVHEVISEERLTALAQEPSDAEDECEGAAGADCETPEKTPVEIVGVRFKPAGKVYYFDPDHASYRENDEVIVETARGIEFGFVVTANRTVMASDIVSPLKKILRMATAEDREHYEENNRRREEAFAVCKEKIIEHNIEMKLIDVEYTFDNNKLLFYFTADGRVDFRELVKDLASIFRTRIELRQIGIRDEAKLMGGLGVCGRPFCCHSFLSDFVQVSIKMAKEQNLSLNSAKISGTCGRLMCCLRYEYDVYEEEIRKTPKMDAVVETPDGEAVVCEVIPLAGLVRVKFLGNHSDMPPKLFHRDDVSVKGKMNWKSGTVTYLDEQK